MRLILAALLLLVLGGSTFAEEAAPGQERVRVAIERGLGFLVKDALQWKKDYKCTSCHHAALVVWSMREAKERGHAVDEPFLAEFTKWIAESGEGKTGVPRPANIPKALNTKAVLYACLLYTSPSPRDS